MADSPGQPRARQQVPKEHPATGRGCSPSRPQHARSQHEAHYCLGLKPNSIKAKDAAHKNDTSGHGATGHGLAATGAKPVADRMRALERRLNDFAAENLLLGRVLQDTQAERAKQDQRLQDLQHSCSDMQQQLEASMGSRAMLQTEVQQLSDRLQRSNAARADLNQLAQDLNAQLQLARRPSASDQMPRDHNSGAASQRMRLHSTQASPTRSLEQTTNMGRMGGMGRMGQDSTHTQGQTTDMGRLGEDLHGGRPWSPPGIASPGRGASPGRAVSSPGRALGLSRQDPDLRQHMVRLEELYVARMAQMQVGVDVRVTEVKQAHQEALQASQVQTWAALDVIRQEAARQVTEAEAGLDKQVHNMLRILEQLQKRCALLDIRLGEAQAAATAARSAAPLRAPPSPRGPPAVDMYTLRQQIVALQREKAQLEDAQRANAAQSTTQAATNTAWATRLRQELCAAVEEQHQATSLNTHLRSQVTSLTGQLSAAEIAIQGLRQELTTVRKMLLNAQSTTVTDALQAAVRDVRGTGARPRDLAMLASGPLTTYVQVLEHALSEADSREGALARAVAEAQYLEEQARSLLGGAREEQLAGQRALLHQARQLQILEQMRLSDVHELQGLQQLQGETGLIA